MKSIEQLQGRIEQLEAHNERLSRAIAQFVAAYDERNHELSRGFKTPSERSDKMLATMHTPEAKAGVAAAFDATPEELGTAAVKGQL